MNYRITVYKVCFRNHKQKVESTQRLLTSNKAHQKSLDKIYRLKTEALVWM